MPSISTIPGRQRPSFERPTVRTKDFRKITLIKWRNYPNLINFEASSAISVIARINLIAPRVIHIAHRVRRGCAEHQAAVAPGMFLIYRSLAVDCPAPRPHTTLNWLAVRQQRKLHYSRGEAFEFSACRLPGRLA
jgi:hypothetical protein